MSKNILFVSIAFPPKNDPECLQTAKYFKYLSQTDFDVDVVTSKMPTLFMPKDEKLLKYFKGYRQLVEIPIPENKYVNFLIRKVSKDFLVKPDSKYKFFKQSKKAIQQLNQKPDLIYSRSLPLSSTFMAEKLVDHYQVPWVLHLSDPWVECPVHKYEGALRAFHEAREQECFTKATYICFTSRKTQEFYQEKYKKFKDKFLFFPNVYDPEDIKDNSYQFGKKLKFVYTGGLQAGRSPKYVFEALKRLQAEDADLLKDTEFIFAGQFDRQNTAHFSEYNLPMVKNLGLLSYPDALALQKKADVLMVIDTPLNNPKEAMFFPSKLLDYIIAQRRILALTDIGSTTYSVVNNKYGACYAHKDIEGLMQEIKKTVIAWRAQQTDFFYSPEIDEQYSAQYNVGRLEKLFQKI
ncbi:MAG: glycosyltransferase family 4 protein [Aureispira sp.]|nr:glycosyltransferase family 4 protein [Aureispira sp.]